MILVPRWDDADDADTCIQHLVNALLQLVPCPTYDVRQFSGAVELQVGTLSSTKAACTLCKLTLLWNLAAAGKAAYVQGNISSRVHCV